MSKITISLFYYLCLNLFDYLINTRVNYPIPTHYQIPQYIEYQIIQRLCSHFSEISGINNMLFGIPYLLTFLSFVSYSYLLGTYSFIHKDLINLFQITKTELGIINGVLGLSSTLGVIAFLLFSTSIRRNIVTYYTWGCIGYMLPFALIVLSSIIWIHPSKIILYIVVVLIGVFRSIFFPSLMIMIKLHKEIYDLNNHIDEQKYKLLTNIWSVCFDVGMVLGFYGCNWLQYTLQWRWELLLIIGLLFMLTTTTFLFLGLRSYIEDRNESDSLQDQSHNQQHIHNTSFVSYFSLINNHLPSKLFLINSTIIDALHLGFVFVLPPFFFSSGYKGNQGYLTAIYSLFIVFGAWLLAISDFILHKISHRIQDKRQQKTTKSSEKAVFLFIFSVSLFFFALTLILLTYISFLSAEKKANGQVLDDSYLNIQMILMCSLGFFFGGPLKSYFSYRTIKAMGSLQKQYENQMLNNQSFYSREQEIQKGGLYSKNLCDKIKGHVLQIGSSLITTNRILTHFSTVIMFVIAFYLIEEYLSFAMAFLAFLGVLGFVFDVIQNIVALKYENLQKQKENKIRMEKQQIMLKSTVK